MTSLAPEIDNRRSQLAKIRNLLIERGVVTNHELNEICYRYAARIHELRQAGWVIKSEKLSKTLWRFTLISATGNVPS